MMWIKLASMAIGASILLAATWWLISTVKENERLTINNLTLEESLKSEAEITSMLRKDIAAKERAIQRRTDKIVAMNQRLLKAKDEVRVITKTVVTEIERECLLQSVPDSVIDFMLDNEPVDSEEGGSEDLSSRGILFPNPHT